MAEVAIQEDREVGRDGLCGLVFTVVDIFPPDCASWILRREVVGPINVFEALTGLFPLLTGREPPFEEALDWLQFT